MQMKNLLRLMGALALTTVATTSVVACGNQAVVNLDTVLKKNELGQVLVADITKPTEKELKVAIKAVPENENINIDGITVEVIKPEEGKPIISAKVTPDGKIYNGDSITLTFTLVHKEDIKDVKVDDLKTVVDSEKTFGDLNTNKEITDAVAAAIKSTTKLDVSVNTDFTLTNDKKKEDKQVAGKVTFTVTAQGDKISGTFTFTDTLQ